MNRSLSVAGTVAKSEAAKSGAATSGAAKSAAQGTPRWRCSAEFHLPRRSIGFRGDHPSAESGRLFVALFIVVFGPLAFAAPALAGVLLVFTVVLAIQHGLRARPAFRVRGIRRRLARRATGPDGGGELVRLEGTVSASERADGVVLGTGAELWPPRFTVTFEGGEAQVEPSALCVASDTAVRLGDRVELLGPATRRAPGASRTGGYRSTRLTLSFEGTPERPIFVRKSTDARG
ncbi:MAG: hypothetical protein AAF447_18410 [Myxococcota bacterium]